MEHFDLCERYTRSAGCHCYIFPVRDGHTLNLVAVRLNAESLARLTTVELSSKKNGGCPVLKYKWNMERENTLKSLAEWTLKNFSTIEEIESLTHNGFNRGNAFEWLIAERLHGTQNRKQNLCYTEGGDLELNGVQYQVKYNKATFAVKRGL